MTKEESWEGQIKSPQPHVLGREAGAHRQRKQGPAGGLARALFWSVLALSDHGRS